MTKPKRPPTNREFNEAVLDQIIERALPADQKADEFGISDLVERGLPESTARRFCVGEWKRGALDRRIGRVRLTGRKSWLYRLKEAT